MVTSLFILITWLYLAEHIGCKIMEIVSHFNHVIHLSILEPSSYLHHHSPPPPQFGQQLFNFLGKSRQNLIWRYKKKSCLPPSPNVTAAYAYACHQLIRSSSLTETNVNCSHSMLLTSMTYKQMFLQNEQRMSLVSRAQLHAPCTSNSLLRK